MYINKKLCLILVEFFTFAVCKAENDYLEKISSYVRSSTGDIADKLSSYYNEYALKKSKPDLDGRSNEESSTGDIADKLSSYYNEYVLKKSKPDLDERSNEESSTGDIADKLSSYYNEYALKKSKPDLDERSNEESSTGDIADKLSSYYNEYALKKSKPDLDGRSNEDREYRAEDENSCEKKLRECKAFVNDISDEALSRRIVNMLLSRAGFREGASLLHGRVELEITALELETLKNFGLGISTLRQVAPILNNVIKTLENDRPFREYRAEDEISCERPLSSELFNFIDTHKQSIFAIVGVLYLFRLLKNMEWGIWKLTLISSYVGIVLQFPYLMEDLQEVNVENMEPVPIQCQPDKMRWTHKIMALVSSTDDCEKYKEAEMNNRPLIKFTRMYLQSVERGARRGMALGIDIGVVLTKIFTDYLPRLSLWIVRNIVALKEFSISAIVSLMLVLCCCYFYYSRCAKCFDPRRNFKNKNDRWMTRFMKKAVKNGQTQEIARGKREYRNCGDNNSKATVALRNVTTTKTGTKDEAKEKTT